MSDNLELVGFYDISQLASRRETERQKQHIGILPWSKSKIEKMLKEASVRTGIQMRMVSVSQQAEDHPILVNVPETDYLKFYIFQVV